MQKKTNKKQTNKTPHRAHRIWHIEPMQALMLRNEKQIPHQLFQTSRSIGLGIKKDSEAMSALS